MDNRLAYLVSKKLTGEINETELFELNDALTSDPRLYNIISLIEIAWKNGNDNRTGIPDVNGLLAKLRLLDDETWVEYQREETGQQEKPSWAKVFSLSRTWKYAAAMLILLSVGWWIYKPANTVLPEEKDAKISNQVTTRPGHRTHIILKDGTKVWLNADSKISYANAFDNDTREVHLSGEAYFEVISNPSRPFIIHSNKLTIRVTGTTFNVRDYPEEDKAETSLLEGKVEVSTKIEPDKVYHLKPNEKIVLKGYLKNAELAVNKDKRLLEKVSPAVETHILPLKIDPTEKILIETAWVNDQLAFADESFREVADKMEKWFNVKIVFQSEALEHLRFTGKFENETLADALLALQYTAPFRYEFLKDQTLVIHKK
ncbi:MAG TPA: FecR domain-containing protein [Phnomibacter sp.]|nr:FecR domain-containing protein [Phnomibacter sp.]